MFSIRTQLEFVANSNAVFDFLIHKKVLVNFRGQIVDVGSGHGRLKQFLPKNSSYTGVDIHPLADIHQDLCQPLPFNNQTFDGAICNAVLEHVSCPDFVLSEIVRVVKPNGYVWLSIPFLQPYHPDPTDFRRFTAYGFRDYVERFSLKVIQEYPVNGTYMVIEHLLFFELVQYLKQRQRWLNPLRWLLFGVTVGIYSVVKIVNLFFWHLQWSDSYASSSIRMLCKRTM